MALLPQVVPQELTRLRLTSQPLLVTPSQFFVPGVQATQPLFPTHFCSSAAQFVGSPHLPSTPQVWVAFVVPTQRFWFGMHSRSGVPELPPFGAPPAPVPPD